MDIVLPNALMIGVEYDLFWTLNPKSFASFVKAFELKREYQDYNNWSLGMYIRSAVASVLDSKNKYPETPLTQKPKVDVNKAVRERIIAKAISINSRFRKEGTS